MTGERCPKCDAIIAGDAAVECPSCGAELVDTEASTVAPTASFASSQCPSDETLSKYLRAKLDDDETGRLEDHVEACTKCDQRLQKLSDQPHAAQHRDAAEPVPDHIGKYKVEKLLGRGAFGDVYRGTHEKMGHAVAIKILKRTVTRRGGRRRLSDDEYRQHVNVFRKEAQTLLKLHHANIVRVYDVDELPDGRWYIVSEFIDGISLAERIAQDRPSFREAAEIVATAADALHYAYTHEGHFVHRDIKPANILLDRQHRPHIIDFGLALSEEDFGNVDSVQGGTAFYMSPEQARREGHRVDNRSDIFGLGVVLYELLTGDRPFRGSTTDEVLDQIASFDHEPTPPRARDDAIPRELERICLKALQKRQVDRYQTAGDFASELRQAFDQKPAASNLPHSTTPTDVDAPPAPAKIVPKGLRSFDEHDADFFLDLLPGPRDRDGLPESIRFWKTRIEQTDEAKSFRATLLNRLRKACPQLPPDLDLIAAMTALRRGKESKKVCIVLDQFEQWLNAIGRKRDTQLAGALRQCDGEHAQALLLIREDFYGAATRFTNELEIPLLAADSRQRDSADYARRGRGSLNRQKDGSFGDVSHEILPAHARLPGSFVARMAYAQAAKVSVELFHRFIGDEDYEGQKPKEWEGVDERTSPTGQHPVQQVSWEDAVLFCNWLTAQEERLTPYYGVNRLAEPRITNYHAVQTLQVQIRSNATGYRLPTEAEWEYACRASSTTDYCFGSNEDRLRDYAVYTAKLEPVPFSIVPGRNLSGDFVSDVPGSKLPVSKMCNRFGLFDMHGNVIEWCSDWYAGYDDDPADNPIVAPSDAIPDSGPMYRGGSFESTARFCQSWQRSGNRPSARYKDIGFRVALRPSGQTSRERKPARP